MSGITGTEYLSFKKYWESFPNASSDHLTTWFWKAHNKRIDIHSKGKDVCPEIVLHTVAHPPIYHSTTPPKRLGIHPTPQYPQKRPNTGSTTTPPPTGKRSRSRSRSRSRGTSTAELAFSRNQANAQFQQFTGLLNRLQHERNELHERHNRGCGEAFKLFHKYLDDRNHEGKLQDKRLNKGIDELRKGQRELEQKVKELGEEKQQVGVREAEVERKRLSIEADVERLWETVRVREMDRFATRLVAGFNQERTAWTERLSHLEAELRGAKQGAEEARVVSRTKEEELQASVGREKARFQEFVAAMKDYMHALGRTIASTDQTIANTDQTVASTDRNFQHRSNQPAS